MKTKRKNKQSLDNTPKKSSSTGILHVRLSFNNTLLTFCDLSGNCVAWFSAGSLGLKGGRKSSVYAIQLCLERVINKVRQHGYKLISIRVSGIGLGRKFIYRFVKRLGIRIVSFQDVTPRPHNGCRNRNKRRL